MLPPLLLLSRIHVRSSARLSFSPEGAADSSPGRKPRDRPGGPESEPRRGDRAGARHLSPLRGSGTSCLARRGPRALALGYYPPPLRGSNVSKTQGLRPISVRESVTVELRRGGEEIVRRSKEAHGGRSNWQSAPGDVTTEDGPGARTLEASDANVASRGGGRRFRGHGRRRTRGRRAGEGPVRARRAGVAEGLRTRGGASSGAARAGLQGSDRAPLVPRRRPVLVSQRHARRPQGVRPRRRRERDARGRLRPRAACGCALEGGQDGDCRRSLAVRHDPLRRRHEDRAVPCRRGGLVVRPLVLRVHQTPAGPRARGEGRRESVGPAGARI
jgi:hypothetical protein